MSTSAERMRRLRARQRGDLLEAVPDETPGPVAEGLEATLAKLGDPDPALCASARALAAALDRSGSAHPATAAELRRTIGQLRADARQMPSDGGSKRPPNALEQLRAARARNRRPGAS